MKADRHKLKLAMARSCMSTDELAIKSEMPLSTVKNVIAGHSVRPVTLGKVARALGVDPDCILATELDDGEYVHKRHDRSGAVTGGAGRGVRRR